MPAAAEAAINYADNNFTQSRFPVPMGADGDTTANAWYRTTLQVPSAGTYTLQVEGADRAITFIDGKQAGSGNIKNGELLLPLQAGKHTLAVFSSHDGRDKLAAYIGAIDSNDNKGLYGRAVIKKGGPFINTLSNWYFVKAAAATAIQQGPPAFDSLHSKRYKIGDDAFDLHEGFGWFQTMLPVPSGAGKLTLQFNSVDENATVFINAQRVAGHNGWNQPFTVAFDADTIKGPVILSVFIENYSNEGGIDKPVRFNTIGTADVVTGWRLRGGPGEIISTEWIPLNKTTLSHKPYFFRSYFNSTPPAATGNHPVWRVATTGLSHGSVWVNKHNLGRYPEKIPVNGLYIPECWLKKGSNELVIFDEEGCSPQKVSVQAEMAAGRYVESTIVIKILNPGMKN